MTAAEKLAEALAPAPKPLYQVLAGLVDAIEHCVKLGNDEGASKHNVRASRLVSKHMPRGSGFDAGTMLSTDSERDRLVFDTSFHHMKDGSYTRWTDHRVIVRPSLLFGYTLSITGTNHADIKDYIHESFSDALSKLIEHGDCA
jgi:hypothetical protein